ncbi:hypothetical protein NJC38_17010 [Pseudomonas sp. 21LCFQ010]|uniref:hypothetical protein n=1 Tax=Pseudomonas sp. 21LCFQ010 TaxID=2957506 RepID=UPI002097BFC3|nr:hypothetical protein [Pseudomonas sp. 21LCFQ010]MCO8163856.1 hypothetical protein [Pseudomonas sp. 21LCFQ010]
MVESLSVVSRFSAWILQNVTTSACFKNLIIRPANARHYQAQPRSVHPPNVSCAAVTRDAERSNSYWPLFNGIHLVARRNVTQV